METQLTSQEINVVEGQYKQKHIYKIIQKMPLLCHVCYLNMKNHGHILDRPERHFMPITGEKLLPCPLVLTSWVSTDGRKSCKAGSSHAQGRAPREMPGEESQGCGKQRPAASSSPLWLAHASG